MARVAITGDLSDLGRFGRKLQKLGPALDTLSRNLAEETLELIREEFEHEQDPDGAPWQSLLLRKGKILQDTGGLRSSWNYTSNRRGFTVGSGKVYAKWHQGGTGIYGPSRQRIYPRNAKALRLGRYGYARSIKGIPPRRMVPDAGLPRAWVQRYESVADDVFSTALK